METVTGKEKINFEKFLEIEKQLEIRIGTIIEVDFLPKNKRMLRLVVDFGSDEKRTVITNIGDKIPEPYSYINLQGLDLPFITNLEPAIVSGVESQAMIMVPTDSNGKVHINFKRGLKLL
jgi:tRNA-binding EMAP/Myf-like protein